MILTITLNPAVDKTVHTDSLLIGQVNRLKNVAEYPGGKGINVTRILRTLGGNVIAMGFVGGYNGTFIEEKVKECGAETSFTRIKGISRVNTNIIGGDGYVTELLDPGPVVNEEERSLFWTQYCENLAKVDVVVISGSNPGGISDEFYVSLIREAKARGKKTIVDACSYSLRVAVKEKPYMIKPNIKELEFLVGKKIRTIEETVRQADELVQSGITTVVVSMGNKGFIHVSDVLKERVKVPKVQVVTTVGCGDAMVAAYAYGYDNGLSDDDIIKYAKAASVANTLELESGVLNNDKLKELLSEGN